MTFCAPVFAFLGKVTFILAWSMCCFYVFLSMPLKTRTTSLQSSWAASHSLLLQHPHLGLMKMPSLNYAQLDLFLPFFFFLASPRGYHIIFQEEMKNFV